MARYYFDLRDGEDFAPDEEGIELATIERVQEEAARSLADFVRDAARHEEQTGNVRHTAIEVRDDHGPVMQLAFTFDLKRLRN